MEVLQVLQTKLRDVLTQISLLLLLYRYRSSTFTITLQLPGLGGLEYGSGLKEIATLAPC